MLAKRVACNRRLGSARLTPNVVGIPPECHLTERKWKAGRGLWNTFPHLFRLVERKWKIAQLGSTNVHLPLGVHLPLSTFFPPGGTSAEKGFRPLDRGSTLFPRGGTLAEPQLHSERGVQSTLSASRLRLVLPMDTWLLPLHSHGTSSMHTHANPYPTAQAVKSA